MTISFLHLDYVFDWTIILRLMITWEKYSNRHLVGKFLQKLANIIWSFELPAIPFSVKSNLQGCDETRIFQNSFSRKILIMVRAHSYTKQVNEIYNVKNKFSHFIDRFSWSIRLNYILIVMWMKFNGLQFSTSISEKST